ncbi:MAG TPA: DUF4881 domain-containing protein [Dissulfurispiraceae bacterium]|nr:DUF4881 domain-containing protein [Dissulfurispiraceae bacterium]
MIKKCILGVILCTLPLLFVSGCGKDIGKVDQGRVIEYDNEKKIVTFVRDVKADPGSPDFSHLPPLTYEMPKDRNEISGAEPAAGYRMKLDTKKSQVIIYDPAVKNFVVINYQLVSQKDFVERDDPLVYDAAAKKPRQFPIIDKDKKTITIYSRRQKILSTFTVPDEYFALPPKSWDAGDEVRVHYKQDGKALKFVNLTRTDINK